MSSPSSTSEYEGDGDSKIDVTSLRASLRAPRKCSICASILHTKRTCPTLSVSLDTGAGKSGKSDVEVEAKDKKRAALKPDSSRTSDFVEEVRGSNVEVGLVAEDIVVYTDGSCLGNKNVKTQVNKAGFGLVVLGKSQTNSKSSTENITLLSQINGPVITDRRHPEFMGAEKGSNNTAELCAIGYVFKWFHARQANVFSKPASAVSTIEIRYDSEYAAKSVTGEYNGKENRELIESIRELYESCCKSLKGGKKSVRFKHVKGHSGDYWNDVVDVLAKEGCTLDASQVVDAKEKNLVFNSTTQKEKDRIQIASKYSSSSCGSSSNSSQLNNAMSNMSDPYTLSRRHFSNSTCRSYTSSSASQAYLINQSLSSLVTPLYKKGFFCRKIEKTSCIASIPIFKAASRSILMLLRIV